MNKLNEITKACERGVHIVNDEKFFGERTVEAALAVLLKTSELPIQLSDDVKEEILEEKRIVKIIMHGEPYLPPIIVLHADLDKAIDAAYDQLKSMGAIRDK